VGGTGAGSFHFKETPANRLRAKKASLGAALSDKSFTNNPFTFYEFPQKPVDFLLFSGYNKVLLRISSSRFRL